MDKVIIDREKNEVILRFNSKFYTKESINQALNDFYSVCTARKEGDAIILAPKEGIDINMMGYEFYNYVLGLMKNV